MIPPRAPQTWFISDLHLQHDFVAGLRGFRPRDPGISAADDHDAEVAANWDFWVRHEDTVWILGDITMANNPLAAFRWLYARPGTKHLILGNHDQIHPARRTAQKDYIKFQGEYAATFASIQTFARRRAPNGGPEYLMSHFPYPGTSEGTDPNGRPYDDRYLQYRLQDLGVPLLHGHTHRNETATISQRGTKQFHVGLDAHGLAPVNLSKIEEWLREK